MPVINLLSIRGCLAFALCLVWPRPVISQASVGLTDSIISLGLATPTIKTSELANYDYERLDFGMNRGIACTAKGVIFACWVAGGDNDNAFMIITRSKNDGRTWSKPLMVIDSRISRSTVNRRNRVGNLWVDPSGKLWTFFDQSMSTFDGRAGLWYTISASPESNQLEWSEPVRLWHGCALNKPVILVDGTWVLPVSLWDRRKIKHEAYKDAFHELDDLRMAHMFASTDGGQTWERRGGVRFPDPQFDEHYIIELRDGTLWMTARTGKGIAQSFSTDKGYTWSEPEIYMEHVNSRHFLCRLKSGRLLLVKHGAINERTKDRSMLMAFLSEDDGETWHGGLLIDERRGVSYPDGFQSPEGTIFISYDRNRNTDGEILMARFTEEDILAGDFVGRKSRAKMLISRAGGMEANEADHK